MYNITPHHFLFLSILTVLSIIFSAIINNIFLKFSKNLGTRNNDNVRWTNETKPSVGGFAFYILFLCSIIFYTIFIDPKAIFQNIQFLGIISSISLGFIMGLADDAYNTNPALKFGVQILCAIILFFTGTQIQLFSNDFLNLLLTSFWVVGIMNSINLLDNMDGITGLISIVITLFLIVSAIFINAILSIYLIILVTILGALIGFMFYNWNPAKLYMGDAGSQFLGIFLASFAMLFIWNQTDNIGTIIHSKQIIGIALVFIIPIIDTTIVFTNRILRGQSPFVGGKDHTSHNLSYLGLSDRIVSLVMGGINLLSCIFALIMSNTENWTLLKAIPFILFWLGIFIIMFAITRKHEYKFKKL